MSNAMRSQWLFPKNEANKVPGWRSDGKGLENKSALFTSDILDEDDMASDSATAVPSQQSVKAFASNPANQSYTQGVSGDTTRTVLEFIREGRTNVHDLGVPSDGSSATAGLKRAIERGGALWVPEGTYNIPAENTTQGGVFAEITKSVDILCHPNAKFVAGTNFRNTSLIRMNVPVDGVGLPNELVSIFWEGGMFDGSAIMNPSSIPWSGIYPPANPGPTGSITLLSPGSGFTSGSVNYCGVKRSVVKKARFVGGSHWISAGGDTLLGAGEGVELTIIEENEFVASRDVAIYGLIGFEGDANGQAGGPIIIRKNRFINCAAGASMKRSVPHVIIEDNYAENCVGAFGIAGSGIDSARTGSISNNLIVRCVRAIDVTLANGFIVENNTILEYGATEEDGTTPITSIYGGYPIVLFGSKYCTVRGNRFINKSSAWSAQSVSFFDLGDSTHTVLGTVTSSHNTFEDNTAEADMVNLGREQSGEAEYNAYHANRVVGGLYALSEMAATSRLTQPATGLSTHYLDTSSSAHTGTTAATAVKSRTIEPSHIPIGEGFTVFSAGSVTGTNGTKLIQASFGAVTLTAANQASGDQQIWFFEARVRRVTSTGWSIALDGTEDGGTTDVAGDFHGLGSSAWDVGVSVTLGSASDTVTVTHFQVKPLP